VQKASLTFIPSTVYTITVGAGGAAQTGCPVDGISGSNSSIAGTGITTITSNRWRWMVLEMVTGVSGGSGGGAWRHWCISSTMGVQELLIKVLMVEIIW
jgi:hypothetical protein